MSIEVNVTKEEIAVSASGQTVNATVSGGVGPVGPQGPPGTTTWDGITDKPATFAPAAHSHEPAEVGLGNVDNTSDAAKPVSSAQAAADAAVASAAAADATSKASAAQAHAIQRANHTGTQAISTVSGLQDALDGKQPAGSYAAASHGHAISDVTGLQSALDAKATPADVTASVSAVIDAAPAALDTLNELAAALGDDSNFASTVTTALAGKAAAVHSHVISDVTGLQTALDGKQAAGSYAATVHTHGISDVTGLQTALDGKAAATHGHTIADVSGLQTALDGKASAVHSHAWSDITSGIPTTLSGYGITDGVDTSDSRLTDARTPTAHNHGASEVTVPDLLLSAFATDDNLAEVLGYIATAIDSKQAAGSYAAASHSHVIADVTGLQTALDGKQPAGSYADAVHGHVITDITGLSTVLNAKANLSSPTFTGTVSGITKAMVGLGNVPNTDATARANHTGTQTLSTISDAGTAASRNVPATGDATSTQVVIGSDTRLTNSRTPTAHKSTHATGGTDALTPADIGAAAASHTHAASDITSGTIATARLGSGTASSSTFLRGDQTYAAPPVQSVDGLTGTVSVSKSDTFEFTRSTYPASATVASTGSYVWSIPAGAKTIEVLAIGGGGGGGSGRLGAAGSARAGGGGGAGGAIIRWMGAVSDSNSSTLYVVVGAGGGGGAAVSASDTNGNSGSAGVLTRVVTGSAGAQSGIIADGGAGGGGGGTSTGSGGGETAWQTTTMFQGGGGATGRVTAGDGAGAYRTAGTAGGGGAGGVDAANANYAGGTGGSACTRVIGDAIFYRGTAGTAGGGNGGNATNGGALFALWGIGGGGGGGNASGAGGTGGNGSRGGGGGGGGAATNGSTSGAGGNGGDGYVRITVWY